LGRIGTRETPSNERSFQMPKAAAVVFADTDSAEGLGRVVNAMTTVKEFKEAGDGATLIFDGAGTKWVAELSNEDHKYNELYQGVRDVVAGACSYCASAYGVKEQVERSGVELLDEYSGHPSLRQLVQDGYQVLTF
jgi:hypothetical protein